MIYKASIYKIAVVTSACFAQMAHASFNPNAFLLTWQDDPTTTMTIQWLTQGDPLPPVDDAVTMPEPRSIPQIGSFVIDGMDDGWWDKALKLDFLATGGDVLPDYEAFGARAGLAWSDDGVAVVFHIRHQDNYEVSDPKLLWHADSVDITIATVDDPLCRTQVSLTPGLAAEQVIHFIKRPGAIAVDDMSVNAVARRTEEGYAVEVLMPWTNLTGFEPAAGSEVFIQLSVNDADGPEMLNWRTVTLHPDRRQGGYVFHLGEGAGAPIHSRAALQIAQGEASVQVSGMPYLVGKTVVARTDDRLLGSAVMEMGEGIARARISLPAPPEGKRWDRVNVFIADDFVGQVALQSYLGATPPNPAIVRYWIAGSDEMMTAETTTRLVDQSPNQTYTQRVQLTDLQPDSAYRFQVAGHPDDYGFKTMPATLDEPLRIAIGGDIRHSQQWMEQTNRVAMQYDPDFIIWGGDFAYADGLTIRFDRWEEWFQAIANTLIDEERNIVPIVGTIGNHEVRGGYYFNNSDYEQTDAWRERIAPFYYAFFPFPGQPGYGVLDFGDYLSLLLLDTDHSNPVEGAQTAWLESELSTRMHVPHVFPIYHVPGFPSHRPFEDRTSIRIREHWVPLFERYGVELAFEHHDHTYKRSAPIRSGKVSSNGVVYFGDGSWGVEVRQQIHDPDTTWYLERAEAERQAIILTLHGTHRHALVVSTDGIVIDEFPETGLRGE